MNATKLALGTRRVIGLFPELLGVGGVQEAGRLTAAAILGIARRRGWSIDFISLNDPYGSHSVGVDGLGVPFRAFGRAKVRFSLAGIRSAYSLPAGTAAVVLAAHPNLALPALWIRRSRPNLKTIVMSHGIEVWKPLPSFRRRALMHANVALAPSTDTANKLIDVQGVAAERVRKLAWPVAPTFLRMADAPTCLRRPAAFPTGLVILTVGRWAASERYKGADDLIRAVVQLHAEIPGLHLVAVGGGDDLPRLRKLAAESGVVERVHFFENLSREDLAACYFHADIFALPSSGEGFGLVFLEAMAFSKPVVGASFGGATDVIEDHVNGLLVPPADSGRLARVLSRLLRDESLRERLGRRGGEIVRERYGFEVFENELANVLGD